MRARLLVLLALAGCAYDDELEPDQTTAAIVGAATSRSFAGQVMLWGGSCSGTVLSEHFILTAAHCVDDLPPEIQLFAAMDQTGQPTMIYEGPIETFIHPSYTGDGDFSDDVAVIHLRSHGIDTSFIGKSPLYADSRTPWVNNSFTSAQVSGWGRTQASLCLPTNAFDPLIGVLRSALGTITNYVGSTTVVRTSVPTCHGDSGGPWYYRTATSGAIQNLQVATTAGHTSGGTRLGTLLPPKRAWIESKLASRVPYRFGFSWNGGTSGGWAYRTYLEQYTVVGQFVHEGNWCLTASGTNQQDPIVLAPCDGRWQQAWWVTKTGEIRSLAVNGMCMDVQGGASGNGTPLWLWPCSSWVYAPAQRFRVESDGEIHAGVDYDKCVDLPWNEPYDGAPLWIYDCNATSAQRWTF